MMVGDFGAQEGALRTLQGEILVLKGWIVALGDAKVGFMCV
jgi:hypothetical protein